MRATLTATGLVLSSLGAFAGVAGCDGGGGSAAVSMDLGSRVVLVPPVVLVPVDDRLDATIDAIRVHVGGADGEDRDADVGGDHGDLGDDRADARGDDHGGQDADGDGAWVSVLPAPVTIDLLDAQAVDALVDGAAVPAGRLTQLRLVLDAAPTYLHAGERDAVACPSCTETGIKVIVHDVTLAPGDVLSLHLDLRASFDASRLRLDPVAVASRR